VPPDLYGQVSSTGSSLKVGSFALGSALAGPLVVGIGARGTILVCAATSLAAAALALLLLRQARVGRSGAVASSTASPNPSSGFGRAGGGGGT
jgi:predicted MFS family arabinose efflux permease